MQALKGLGVFLAISAGGSGAAAVEIVTGAALECTFVSECVETEACQETDFDVTVTGTVAVGTEAFQAKHMDSAVFSVPAEGEADVNATVINAQDGDTGHLIVTTPDGAAKYINLMISVPMVITYHGSCALKQAPE